MSFSDLKKRDSQKELESLNTEAEKTVGGGFVRDPRYWRPLLDSQGSGSALIRFLPAPEGEELPFVNKCSFAFKGPTTGRWYIHDSPVSIKERDPVAELNSRDWNSGTEEGKARARYRRMRRFFVSNIYVLEHKARREDEGKVFLYQYGRTIYDMLKEKRTPSFADQEAFNPFNFWKGANFRLRIRKKDGFPNYDSSEFETPGPLASDEKMSYIYEELHSLTAEVAPDKFESYEVLKSKLDEVLGSDPAGSYGTVIRPTPIVTAAHAQAAAQRPLNTPEDEDAAYFESLVNSR